MTTCDAYGLFDRRMMPCLSQLSRAFSDFSIVAVQVFDSVVDILSLSVVVGMLCFKALQNPKSPSNNEEYLSMIINYVY